MLTLAQSYELWIDAPSVATLRGHAEGVARAIHTNCDLVAYDAYHAARGGPGPGTVQERIAAMIRDEVEDQVAGVVCGEVGIPAVGVTVAVHRSLLVVVHAALRDHDQRCTVILDPLYPSMPSLILPPRGRAGRDVTLVRPDGYRAWWRDGLLHRAYGPAIERADGYRSWWRNGKLHRDDGPAIERADGSCEWWVDGERVDAPAEGERPSL